VLDYQEKDSYGYSDSHDPIYSSLHVYVLFASSARLPRSRQQLSNSDHYSRASTTSDFTTTSKTASETGRFPHLVAHTLTPRYDCNKLNTHSRLTSVTVFTFKQPKTAVMDHYPLMRVLRDSLLERTVLSHRGDIRYPGCYSRYIVFSCRRSKFVLSLSPRYTTPNVIRDVKNIHMESTVIQTTFLM
jgi:hypothetical protein